MQQAVLLQENSAQWLLELENLTMLIQRTGASVNCLPHVMQDWSPAQFLEKDRAFLQFLHECTHWHAASEHFSKQRLAEPCLAMIQLPGDADRICLLARVQISTRNRGHASLYAGMSASSHRS